MNKQVILVRNSTDETTFAVVDFAGCAEVELRVRLQQAVRLWAKTEYGREVLADVGASFNVGDLAHHTPAGVGREDDLSRCLLAASITYLDIDVYSQDGVIQGWDFDTPLV